MNRAPVRLDPPPAWLERPAPRAIGLALPGLRFVGGAVRNSVLGVPVGDLDAATPLEPADVIDRLRAAGIRTIPTGLAHGTVSALVADETIEITTLRRDVETDGRHARVEFTDDWAADAARRDFTMNALYLGLDGRLYDPLGGYADCVAGRVRFIGEPGTRLEEDALRLLRFYRMHAYYGRGPLDAAGRAACRAHAGSLGRLSGERIRTELLKLLLADHPVPVVEMVAADGIWRALFEDDADLARLHGLMILDAPADALLRLAALLTPRDARDAAIRLRLSARERERLIAATSGQPPVGLDGDARSHRRLIYRLGSEAYRDRLLLAAAGSSFTGVRVLLEQLSAWQPPRLPVDGTDLGRLGVAPGPALGSLLKRLDSWWVAHDFEPSRDACLDEARRMIASAGDQSKASRLTSASERTAIESTRESELLPPPKS